MRLRLVLSLLPIVLVAACSKSVTGGAAASCVMAAKVGDVEYGQFGEVSADRVGPEFTRTVRHRGCDDVIIWGEPSPERWKSGDSSFPAGTPLYASLDDPTSDVLLVRRGDGRYMALRKFPHPGSPAAGGTP
ncbi:MAG TPA: hypothetical protein VEX86_19725 [Longimicrobium sp.]|nr:hypothetical protein [Longimicrobium sp.]